MRGTNFRSHFRAMQKELESTALDRAKRDIEHNRATRREPANEKLSVNPHTLGRETSVSALFDDNEFRVRVEVFASFGMRRKSILRTPCNV
jgi:hypothetical protein